MPIRCVFLQFHLDSNCIRARRTLENMTRLERWMDSDVIWLEKSAPPPEPAVAGAAAVHRVKAADYHFSVSYADTRDDIALVERIADVLYPGGPRSAEQYAHVECVFKAARHHRLLVTSEPGSGSRPCTILHQSLRLERELGVVVVTDAQSVEMVKAAIGQRDGKARRVSREHGIKLPAWVGRD